MIQVIQWLVFITILISANNNGLAYEHFFPDSTVGEMKMNLDKFLQEVPQNNGQKDHINRVLKYSEHNQLMLFIDTDYSLESIKEIAKLKEPFLLIETLDMISVNLGKRKVFSNFFIDKIVENAKKRSVQYMMSFIDITKKSDGYYLEYLSEKYQSILESNPEVFLEALDKSDAITELCNLLLLGDRMRIIRILESLDSPQEYSKTTANLLMCIEGK